MKKQAAILFFVVSITFAVGFLRSVDSGGNSGPAPCEETKADEASPPPSLDAYYPPRAPRPQYLFQMIALGNAFTGIISDLTAGDMKYAEANLAAFKNLYADIAKLVPEWQKLFPHEVPAEAEKAFQSAAGSKNPAPFMAAVEKIHTVCGSCHYTYMAAVQRKYHWKDFRSIMTKDPDRGRTVGFAELMMNLNLGFSGSWTDAGQGQPESAQKRLQEFQASFRMLKETCEECHGTSERKYYVDAEAQALVDTYGKALGLGPGGEKKAAEAMTAVGNEICFKCHLVHIPAAYSKHP